MKRTGVFVKAALALCCCLGIALGVEVDCSQYSSGIGKDGTVWVACPRDLKPVCGTDGTTYSNECGICLHNTEHSASVEKAHDGECELKSIMIDCGRYQRTVIDGHVMVACPRILEPVCGSDSFTYDNECGICAYNAEHHTNISKIHDGECKQDIGTIDCDKYPTRNTEDGKVLVSCPRILSPVCGTDGITYDNECGICAHNGEHRTHVSKKHNGKCRQETSEIDCSQYPSRMIKADKAQIRCPRILLPVCGTDGFTYDNECGICAHNLEHGTHVKKSHEGRCKEKSTPVDCSTYLTNTKTGEAIAACPFILHEICGTDSVTYSNDCVLCAHNIEFGTNVAKKHDGRCTEEVPQLDCSQYPTTTLKDGRQLMACTMIYDPICGTDGVTYASECMLCAHNLDHQTNLGKRKNGRCEEDITKEHCKNFQEVSSVCTMEYLPHCGSDGKTYGNRCVFCNAYLKSNRTLNLMSMTEC
ncbi:ovoinhibitor-like [Harpia harpyja]|uniref:ovoinhibitor-like n=1 Tax=Harpia harpyja TaxID=202280 RepID=UPI0022B0A972|nr:ovoinhibitor-like [Harpia harpyja]